MTRPAIVIGLGGTGQWVVTFLKKELLEIGGGKMPPGVKLLAFDTTSRVTARAGQGTKRQTDEDIRAGSVELIEGKEFIPIGENVSQLVSEIAQGKHSHLQWFPARAFQSKLPPAAFNTKEGSGQIRQMGRVSLFRDLSSMTQSKILAQLRTAMMDLQGKVSRDMQMEVIIVGSLAGGTGAGMLVDMALLVRAQAQKLVANNYVVRGFFVLPRAFTAGGLGEGRDMLARSFAAWRELDRFMIVSERFGLRQINYHEQNQDLRIRIDRRAYDVSYMVDPARHTVNTLENVKGEEGIFPAVAQCISVILDEKAGKEYTEFITTNLAGKLAQLPRRPYHSTIGSYTIKVPVYYAEEKFSHQLALETLHQFLAPVVNDKGRATSLSDMNNKEVPEGHVGRPAVLKFMASDGLTVGDVKIPNTMFMPLMADLRLKEARRNAAIAQQVARGGLTVVNSRYMRALTDISQDDEGKLIVRDIADELQFPIWKDVPPSRQAGDTPEAAVTRIANRVPQVRHEHYGLDTATGERLRGKYGKALERARLAQVARYRKLLRAWTQQVLNGESADPIVARGGKLGYVRSFYAELVETCNYFLGFLTDVRRVRSEDLRLATRTKEAKDRAWHEYDRLKGKKCWLTFWDDFTHPDAHRAQRNYLLAEQRDIDVRKDDILLDVLEETTRTMQSIADGTLKEIDNWVAHLATGDQALNIKGLYPEAVESLAKVNINHELDRRLSKISEIIGEHEYKSDVAFVADAVSHLRWQAEEAPDLIKLNCGVEFPSDEQNGTAKYQTFYREGENPVTNNLEMILDLAQRPYRTLRIDHPLAREIASIYPTGQKLAETVVNLAEPMYMTSSTMIGPEIVACYIRVHSDLDEKTKQYFKDFETEMKARKPEIKGSSLTLVDSEDPYKMTIVRSNDLLPSSDFQMWQACQDAYIQQVTDPHRGIPAAELHVFPAEINACYYEQEMPAVLGKNYHTLHPNVVALLEDREKFEMFFRAYALGFIRIDEGTGKPFWAFKLPKDKEAVYLSKPSEILDSNIQEDIFQVIHNFVMEGVDQRPGMGQSRYVDWEKLRDTILTTQRDLGKSKASKRYRDEMDNPDGIIQRILADVRARRSQIADEVLRKTIGQENEDLADVATVVFLKAIQATDALSK